MKKQNKIKKTEVMKRAGSKSFSEIIEIVKSIRKETIRFNKSKVNLNV